MGRFYARSKFLHKISPCIVPTCYTGIILHVNTTIQKWDCYEPLISCKPLHKCNWGLTMLPLPLPLLKAFDSYKCLQGLCLTDQLGYTKVGNACTLAAPMGHLCLQMQQLHFLEVHVSTVSSLPCRQPMLDFPAAFMWLLESTACRGPSQKTSASLESHTDLQP